MAPPRRLPTEEELALLSVLNDSELARRIGVHRATVRRWREEYGIPNPATAYAHPPSTFHQPMTARPNRVQQAPQSHVKLEVHDCDCLVQLERDITVVVLSDLHLPEADPDAMCLARSIVTDIRPDLIVLNGDLLDVFALTSWPVSPQRRSFAAELDRVRQQIASLARWAPQATWIWLEGNHEQRFTRYLWRHASELWQIDDLNLPRLVRAPEHWLYLAHPEGYRRRHEYAAPQVRIGRLYILHGDTIRSTGGLINVARTIYLKLLKPVIVGHWHRAQVYLQTDYAGQTSGAWAVPCLTGPRAHYATDRVMDQGLAVVHASHSGLFEVQVVPFLADHTGQLRAFLHGKLYSHTIGAEQWW